MINICEIQRSDINRDGKVDMDDTIILGRAYGSSPGDATWNPDADINQDGRVDATDMKILENDFGRECQTPPTIPLIAVGWMVGLGILYILTR